MTRILIIKPSSLGDIIHGLLVTESIRQQMDGVEIDWVARDIFAPLVDACDTVKHVHLFHRGAGFGAYGQLIQDIRDVSYDWVLDMQGLARSGIITQFSKTQRSRCVGRRDAREASQLAYGKLIDMPCGREPHAVDILREFLPALGLQNELKGFLTFSAVESSSELPDEYVLIFPGSRRAEKEWHGFFELSRQLIKDGRIVVWAGDVSFAGDSEWPKDRFHNLTAKTELASLPSIVARAQVVICNDSGPMHLAAAMGKPVLGIFGPTSANRFGPYPLDAPTNHVITAPHGKLERLTVESVHAAVKPL
ncbi:MAG: glycosyltransferase family 9 protein [Verrucomicrobiota bacterium]